MPAFRRVLRLRDIGRDEFLLVPTGYSGAAPYRDTEGVDKNNGISPSTSVG